MQQRQLRLGDTLDDYCPRERRLTNHAVVAMVGPDVMRTRCTTCDAEHEYKHAKVPRQRKKPETPAALYSQVLAGGPRRVVDEAHATSHDDEKPVIAEEESLEEAPDLDEQETFAAAGDESTVEAFEGDAESIDEGEEPGQENLEEGPVHRPLIRATLPRPAGQPPPARPAPDFTIRQPGGRPGRFRPRHAGRGGQSFNGGNRSMGGGGFIRGGAPRPGGGNRPPGMGANRHHAGRKRSK